MSSVPSSQSGTFSKVAVVTGSNKGIGFAIIKELCKKFDGTVVLTSRDEGRGESAIEELNKLGFFPQYHQLDIDDEASIIKFRDYLQVTYGGLDVLVNNAAIMFHKTDIEPLGNQAESHARVVNISSSAGHLSRISGYDPAATNLKQKLAAKDITTEELCHLLQEYISAAQTGDHGKLGWPNNNDCYVVSKMALCVLTRIQQKEFDADSRSIVVNSVHPGYVKTDMTRHKGILSPDRGAVAPCWLALLPPNVDKPKGDFVWHDQQIIDWVNGPLPSYY